MDVISLIFIGPSSTWSAVSLRCAVAEDNIMHRRWAEVKRQDSLSIRRIIVYDTLKLKKKP
jgi:hypothetical protein